MEIEKTTLARERWGMLRSILLDKKRNHKFKMAPPNSVSVRRFSSFNLFTVVGSTNEAESHSLSSGYRDDLEWIRYVHKSSVGDLSVDIALLSTALSLDDLQGFNNTGNLCIWPSEEVMAYYCLQNRELFKSLSICELGAGMTGLAGVFLAQTSLPSEVFVTDGNSKAVVNLELIMKHNQLKSASAEKVVWKGMDLCAIYAHLRERFDVILCADCLFFSEVHQQLIILLLFLMKLDGKVIMFAPERAGTLKGFCDSANGSFDIEVSENYLSVVWDKHLLLRDTLSIYEPDIHYPKLITMKRKT